MTHTDHSPATRARRCVFVYGTLRRGEVNDINQREPAPEFIGAATLSGTLFSMGWYPGLVLGGDATVAGEVYAVSPELEDRLDEVEGLLPEPTGEYSKRDVKIEVEGRVVECFVYEIAAALVAHLEPLPDGDWLKRVQA